MHSSHGRTFAIAVFVFVLTLSPYAHAAETAALTVNDPFTDAIQFWSAVLNSADSFAHQIATGLASPQTFTTENPQQPHAPQAPMPSSLAAVATLATESDSEIATPSTGAADTSVAAQPPQSRSPPSNTSSGATIHYLPAPATNASAFVTQTQYNAGLSALGQSLRQLISYVQSEPVVSGAGAPLSAEAFAPSQRINNLENVTISNATFSGVSGLSSSDIPALNYLQLSGGTLAGDLLINGNASTTDLFASNATVGTLSAGTFNATGTSTLAGINLPTTNCSTFGNGGKLTTDSSGNVICAGDQGGSGSTVAGANGQIQFNGFGSFGASPALAFATSTGTLSAPTISSTNVSTANATSTTLAVTGTASTSNLIASNSFTLGALSGFLKATAGVVSTSFINLASDVTGVLPIGNGGTGTSTAPSNGQVLVGNAAGGYNLVSTSSLGIVSAAWGNIIGSLANQTDLQSALNAKLALSDWYATTTNGLAEGSNNLYFTNGRVASVIAGTTTDALKEGSTNLYFSNARAQNSISVSGTPLTYSAGVIGINQANGSQAGYLASADWTTFNNKIASSSLSGSTPITYNSSTGAIGFDLTHANTWTGTQTFSKISATGATTTSLYITGITSKLLKTDANGQVAAAVAGTDYQAPITTGNLTTGSNLSVSGGTGAVIGSGASISLGSNVVTSVTNDTNVTGSITSNALTLGWTGLLGVSRGGTGSSTLSGILKGNGTSQLATAIGGTDYEFPLTFSSPLSRSTNTISIPQATGSANGYLGSADWTTFNGKLGSSTISSLTANSIPKWTGSTLANSLVTDTGTAVGIGTSTPFALFSVSGGDTRLKETVDSPTALVVENAAGTSTLQVSTLNTASDIFQIASSTGSVLFDITSAGNVGIGTTTPDTNLSVFSATKPGLEFSTGTTGAQWTEGIDTGTGNIFEIASSTALGTNPRFAINAAGNIGIGTTSPAGPLEIFGTDSSTALASGGGIFEAITNADQTAGNFDSLSYREVNSAGAEVTGTRISGVFNSHTAGAENADLVFLTRNAGTLSEKARLSGAGNFGIGTTSPGSIFSLNGVANWTGATSTFYSTGGINLTGGCFSINGTCITGGGGGGVASIAGTANQITASASTGAVTLSLPTLVNLTNASSSVLSVAGEGYFGTASTSALIISGITNGSGQCLQINSAGLVTGSGSACGGTGSTPAGSPGAIQFNSSGAFGGTSNLFWDTANTRLGIGTSSPNAELSVATPNGASGSVTTLFSIASSTPTATTTLFSIDNVGNVISTLAAASSFTVGANGLTNPAFQISASTTNAATGLKLVSNLGGNGVSLSALSSATNETFTIQSKGAANLDLTSQASAILTGGNQIISVGSGQLSFHTGVFGNNASPGFLVLSAGALNQSANTEASTIDFADNQIVSHANDTGGLNVALNRDFIIAAPTDAFTSFNGGANNIGAAATFAITGAPIMGNFGTTTNAYAILVGSSTPSIMLNASTTNSYGLGVFASGGAVNNYAAIFQQ